MIHNSFSILSMTFLASNLIIILISLCFLHEKLMLSIGYRLLSVCLIFTVIRFLSPIEFPFTKSIYLSNTAWIHLSFFQTAFYKNDYVKISAWFLFKCVWIIGALIILVCHIRKYRRCARYIAIHGRYISNRPQVAAMMDAICKNRKNPFRVIAIPDLDVPQIFGILSPRILIPADMDLSSEEFYYALRHETYHYYHHDLWLKEIVNILCILYWWNPFCYLFRKRVSLILEMHVDDSLVNGDRNTANAYMHALINMAETAADKQSKKSIFSNTTVSMVNGDCKQLERRFKMLQNKDTKFRVPLFILLLGVVGSIYLCSYAIIFEARNTEPDVIEQPDDFIISSEVTMYAIPKEDGTYDIYLNGHFIENEKNLDHYPDITIQAK